MLNTKGKKVTLLAGVLTQGLGLILFGYCDKIKNTGAFTKWLYFSLLMVARALLGFGNGCI